MTAIEDRRDLDKRYKFENIIEDFLKEQSDSSRFIEYCELDTDDPSRDHDQSNDDPQRSTRVSMEEG